MMGGNLNGVHNGKRASEPRTRFPMGCTFPLLPERKWTRILMVLACVGILSLLALSRTQIVYRPVAPPPPRSSEKSGDRLFNGAVDVESAAIWNAMLRPVKGHGPCSPVLERASQGRWVPRDDVTSGEREAVEQFLVTVRGYQKLPVSVQRKDNKCGESLCGVYGCVCVRGGVTVRGYQKLPVSVQRKDNKCGESLCGVYGCVFVGGGGGG